MGKGKSEMVSAGDSQEGSSVEGAFEGKALPAWWEQITVRSIVVSVVLGTLLSIVTMKLCLTTGIMPSMNMSAGLLGFFLMRTWTSVQERCGVFPRAFTRQENTIVQTCVVACASISFSGGFGTYILAMTKNIANGFNEANDHRNTKDLSLGQMIIFLFLVSFVGLFSIVPLRKIMIIGHRLTYPSGTATAHLINSFHTAHGAIHVNRQVSLLFKSFGGSMLWSFFQWFYTAGIGCGFSAFPSFGLQAYQRKFYFDFSATFVGMGMICPLLINISMFVGSIISWGLLWPFIERKKGRWYDATLPPTSLRGLNGYKVFISVAMILGDGLAHFLAIFFKTMHDMLKRRRHQQMEPNPFSNTNSIEHRNVTPDDRRRMQVFLRDEIPNSVAFGGYVLLATISVIAIPLIFNQLRHYQIAIVYIFAPLFAFCNAYGSGLTDVSLASSYAKLAILIFGAWIGVKDGGVIAGLAGCGLMMGIVATASDLMQDFKTGYLTLTSPRSMFISQVIGTGLGCVISPVVFWTFYEAYQTMGGMDSPYPAPFANIYRGIALVGVKGLSKLPQHCLEFCFAFFLMAIAISCLREVAKHKQWRIQYYIPSITGMAVPFVMGSFFTIDMCVGSLILYLWEKTDREGAQQCAPTVASGLICGDGIFTLPASILSLLHVEPPICMKFLSAGTNRRVDVFLQGLASAPN